MELLAETLTLARLGGSAVHPDPLVGAIVVEPRTNAIVGRGYHGRNGGSHAEPVAIAAAQGRAVGSTLYCNLEPCGYDAAEKRQPPCTRSIIEAGVARVIVGQIDPHPSVRGVGLQRLREAGIQVDMAPDPMPFWEINAVFTTVMTLGRPFIHVATSPEVVTASPLSYDVLADAGFVGVPTDARSILVLSDLGLELALPEGWAIDFVEGRPAPAWEGSLLEGIRSEGWRPELALEAPRSTAAR